MNIEHRPLADIKPYEQNPRINDAAVEAVAASIREFGFRQPIVVDTEGVIVCGHTRWKAAQLLKLETAPVHVATDLTPEQIRAYRIADNKTAELAEWNLDLLPIELAELQGLDIDLSLLGFNEDEIARLLSGEAGVKQGLTDPDAVPEPPDDPVTQRGDLWVLGEHRLLCGDSSSAADLDRLLDGATIDLVNMDPPYNVKVEPRSNNAIAAGNSSFSAAKKGGNHQRFDLARHPEKSKPTQKKMRAKDRPLENDFVTEEAFDEMLLAWFGNAARVLKPGGSFYIWGGYANLGNYPGPLRASGLYFSQAIIWDKQHPVLTRKDFMGAFEVCQPPDTQIRTADGLSQIQNLRDGDRVVSFSRQSSAIVGLRRGMEVRMARRSYRGPLYEIVADDRATWCTAGHFWSVKMAPEGRDLWCTYLMQRGDWWRVGISKIQTTWGFGLKQRLCTERGDAAWVLSIHRNREEAQLAEHILSTSYGIPTAVWEKVKRLRRSEAMIRRIYEILDPDTLERSARRALHDHHRDIMYPLVARGRTRPKYGCRVPAFIRTCNLLPEVMAIPVPRKGQSYEWVPIRAVDVQSYSGPVYSMDVEKHHHYIADGLVTHNCFYGWREGAGHHFFGPNNATDLWHIKKVNPQAMVHLTEKPVELAVRSIQYSSRPGENVLDLFGGSGSTLIGCEQTDRRAYLMEIDPAYCDVIVQRWEQFTGGKAERHSATEIAA